MRTLFTLVMFGTLAAFAEGSLRAAEPPDLSDRPWADTHVARVPSTTTPSTPVVVAESVPAVPVSSAGVACEPLPEIVAEEKRYQAVWGEVDAKVFPDAGRVAPNGVSYSPLFSLDLDFNIWLCRSEGVYLFFDARYWGERGTPGQTHGNFDYTRREFDFSPGVAWNYYGPWEVRVVGYADENFNRGNSLVSPTGTTNNGDGIEQRLYLNDEYAKLGQEGFNESRLAFVSLGYYPTKSMIGADGDTFKPGLFSHLRLIQDIPSTCCYGYLDLELYFDNAFVPRRLDSDVGLAFTPFASQPKLELRLGSEFNTGFTPGGVRNMSLPYVSVRFNY